MRTRHPGSTLGTAPSPFPSLAQAGTGRHLTAQRCLERRGQGSVSFPACEAPDFFPWKHQAVLVVLYPSISWSRIFQVNGFYHSVFHHRFQPQRVPCSLQHGAAQCKMTSHQCGSFMLTRKCGNAQIFTGRKGSCTEVLWMFYPID